MFWNYSNGRNGPTTEDITMTIMKSLKHSLAAFASVVVLSSGLTSPLLADDNSTLPFASEVDNCIAAVNAKLDLTSASRVRHVVNQRDHAGRAYAFAIETSVFTAVDTTRYAAYCVASGDQAPSRFRITREIS